MKAETLNQRYRLNSRIGQGGFGAVYKATDLVLNREVAVKVLNITNEQQGDLVQRFITEAQIASKLKHANTMTIYDFGKTIDQRCFLVSELLVGQSLHEKLANGKLTVPYTLEIIYQVCLALQEAHQNKIVHRDIKPANIYLNQPYYGFGFVKLLDFGIAKILEERSNTVTGQMMGTPHYMSPEQIVNIKLVDHKTDIYSLGIVVFHCIMGKVPFNDESYFTIMKQQMSTPLPKLEVEGVTPEILADVQQLVSSMTIKDPRKRIQSIDEVINYISMLWEKHPSLRSANPSSPALMAISTNAPQMVKTPTSEIQEIKSPVPQKTEPVEEEPDYSAFDQLEPEWHTQHSATPAPEIKQIQEAQPIIESQQETILPQKLPTNPTPIQLEKSQAIAQFTIAQPQIKPVQESKMKLWLSVILGVGLIAMVAVILHQQNQKVDAILNDQEIERLDRGRQKLVDQHIVQEQIKDAQTIVDIAMIPKSIDMQLPMDMQLPVDIAIVDMAIDPKKGNQDQNKNNHLPNKQVEFVYQVEVHPIPKQSEYELDETIKIEIIARKNGKKLSYQEQQQLVKLTFPKNMIRPIANRTNDYRLIKKGKGTFKACIQSTCSSFHFSVDSTLNELNP